MDSKTKKAFDVYMSEVNEDISLLIASGKMQPETLELLLRLTFTAGSQFTLGEFKKQLERLERA